MSCNPSEILIDRLDFINAIRILLTSPKPCTIFYIDATGYGLWLMGFFKKCCAVHQLHFRMIDIRDKQGSLIRLRVQFVDINDFAKDHLTGKSPFEIRKSVIAPERGVNLLQTLYVLHVLAAKLTVNTHQVVVKLDQQQPWFEQYVITHFPSMKVKFYHSNELIKNLLRFIKHHPAVRSGYYHVINRFRTTSSSKVFNYESSIKNTQPSRVMVEYYGHLNVEYPQLNSDLFFYNDARIDADDLLISFNINRDPIDAAKMVFLEKHEFKAIALCPAACGVSGSVLFSPLLPIINANDALLKYWQQLFIDTTSRMYVTWFKYDPQHMMITQALKKVDGVMVMYQRAIEDLPSVTLMTSADVMFGFSAQSAAIEQLSGSQIPYYVITGYLGDHRVNLLRPIAAKVRQEIMANGATKIIAFFDENSNDDERWHTGHELMRANYKFLLERVIETPWLGLVLKPKIPVSLRKRLGSVSDLLEQAIKTGRCRIFDEGGLIASYPPVAAALASDIAIHGHLCAATAGVEAALAGIPTLLLDREGWPQSSLNRLGRNRVVFDDWSTMYQACLNHWGNPGHAPGLGQWGDVLNEFDPYRDGQASLRASAFLGDVYRYLKSGDTRDGALKKASNAFAKKWGQDKIVSINS